MLLVLKEAKKYYKDGMLSNLDEFTKSVTDQLPHVTKDAPYSKYKNFKRVI